jgi:hypothetical protein
MASTWRCHREGSCCRAIAAVVMTDAEKVRVEHAAPADTALAWTALPNGFWSLQAGPCPLLTEAGQCGIYADRPFNCRRWGCFRPTTTIPLSGTPFIQVAGRLLPAAIATDRRLRAQVARLEEQARPWAEQHGWGATDGR